MQQGVQQQRAKVQQIRAGNPVQPPVSANDHHRRHGVHRRRLIVLMGLLIVICGIGVFQLVHSHQALAQRETAVRQADRSLTEVKAQKADLKVQIDQLKNTDYLMKLVREKYLVSKKGEIVFSLPHLTTTPSSTTSTANH